jgi:O-antigen/teichoic acid export membrane protein
MTERAGLAASLRLPLYRNAYALILSAVLGGGLGILYWALAARIYPTEDVGIGASLVSILMFVSIVSQLNLRSAMYRYLPQAGRRAWTLVAGAYAFVVGAVVLIGLAVAVVGAILHVLPETRISSPAIALAFILGAVVWSLFSFQDHILTSLRYTVWVPVESVVFSLVKIGALFLLIDLHPFGVYLSWVVSAAVGVLVVSGIIFRVLLRRVPTGDDAVPISVRGIVRYAAADYAAGIFSMAGTALMPVLVFLLLGATASAHFYAVWLITTTLYLVPISMLSSLMVEHASDKADFRADARHALFQVGLLLTLPIAALLLAAPIILSPFGPEYGAAGELPLRLLALSIIPYTVNAAAAYYARSQARMRSVIAIEASVAIPSLILAVVLVPQLGLTGVSVAVLMGQSAVAVVTSLTVARPLLVRRAHA